MEQFSLPAGPRLTVLSATVPAELKIILMKLVVNFWVDNTRQGNIFKRYIPAVTAASLLALATFRSAWGSAHLGWGQNLTLRVFLVNTLFVYFSPQDGCGDSLRCGDFSSYDDSLSCDGF